MSMLLKKIKGSDDYNIINLAEHKIVYNDIALTDHTYTNLYIFLIRVEVKKVHHE